MHSVYMCTPCLHPCQCSWCPWHTCQSCIKTAFGKLHTAHARIMLTLIKAMSVVQRCSMMYDVFPSMCIVVRKTCAAALGNPIFRLQAFLRGLAPFRAWAFLTPTTLKGVMFHSYNQVQPTKSAYCHSRVHSDLLLPSLSPPQPCSP